jgi:hypothetical protein
MEQIAALRADWFARLAEAIDGAQRVAWQLRTYESAAVEARELYGRLEAARLELESLRGLATRSAKPIDPHVLERLGWTGSLSDQPD